MHFTVIFCCYILLPYFASLVSPPQEAINCNATGSQGCGRYILPHHICSSTMVLSEEETDGIQPANLPYMYFEQKLDHYHYTDATVWRQRYLMFDGHYYGNGIIYLRIGTDADITSKHMQTGRWYEYAKDAKALSIGIELRGHGISLSNGNIMDENIKYLTTEQTLADVASFIYNFRNQNTGHQLPNKLKWVVYGRGRQGAFAVWLRMQFPHLVHAVLSLSAPLLAEENFKDFFHLVEKDMLNTEQQFKDQIQKAYGEIQSLLDNQKYKSLRKDFRFCNKKILKDKADREKNIRFMYFTFAQAVAKIMQYGNDDMKSIKNKVTNIMLDKEKDYKNLPLIKRFGFLVSLVSKTCLKKGCLHVDYNRAISVYKTKTDNGYNTVDFPLADAFGDRADLYQSCTEFGQFKTIDNFFGTKIGLEFFTEFCGAVFGELSTKELLAEGVRKTNVFYGGSGIEVSHVAFVYGSVDPYRTLGSGSVTKNSILYRFPGARHCDELDNLKDIANLNNFKQEIFKNLTEWVTDNKEITENNNDVIEVDETMYIDNAAITEGTEITGNNDNIENDGN